MSFFRPARPSDIPIGLGAERAVYDLWGRPQWARGRKARRFDERRAALAQGLWIWAGEGEPEGAPIDQEPEGAGSAARRLEAIHDRLRLLLDDGALPDNFADVIWRAAGSLQSLALSAPRASLAWLLMSSRPSNSLLNSIHAAFLSELLGLRLGLEAPRRRDIACAALTMNWTILDLQDELNAKGKTPSAGERLAIMSHPSSVERLLLDYGVRSPLWLSCCKQHHEDPTGRGYPDKLAGSELAPEGALLRCADRYVVMVASRAHRLGLTPMETLEHLREQERSFEPPIVEALADILGPIPPGSMARALDGSLGWLIDEPEPGSALLARADGSLARAALSELSLNGAPREAPTVEAMDALRQRP